MKLKKAIIAAPFGTYITLPGCTSTRGTYTWTPRPGAVWGALTRIKFTPDGIVNQMGLRNPGICSQWLRFKKHPDAIWSIYPDRSVEWMPADIIVELNMSCPNVGRVNLEQASQAFRSLRNPDNTICKLPADFDQGVRLFELAFGAGVTAFHCCNTIKTAHGGLSGRAIQAESLPLIRYIKREAWQTKIIGGGGIYTPDDVKRYRDAGAEHFSLATIFFTPWRVPAVMREIYRER